MSASESRRSAAAAQFAALIAPYGFAPGAPGLL